MIPIPSTDIYQAVRSALREDLALGDATTAALFSGPCPARGLIVAPADTGCGRHRCGT
ncbi:MAG: hypothetical protein KatS3mg082_0231 [Nitrospiraceae bacterium]|nr:MAG: hypothetical protein KatS3mg082_0231 [Nitrospiraceae bacterium]